ncbi:hypothetical protein J4E08_23220 [Sagittula sp. NFXS13]|uniref:hypothetical protein n=1 Tax=Sagittula sp. NFXS13 TaxID=2819095 RepID=UPI0032DFDB30
MSVEQDKEVLLDALYEYQLSTGMRPSIIRAQMLHLPEWDRNRLIDAAKALEGAGDILNPAGPLSHVDLSSTARLRASARTKAAKSGGTTYNIGSATNSPFQHIEAGGHGVQNIQYQTTVNDLRTVIDLYRQHVDSLNLDTTQRQRADKAVATIEAQIVDEDPDQGIVRAAGKSLKTIVEGAIGGALGNAVANPGI